MQIFETRFITLSPSLLTVLVLLAVGDDFPRWYSKGFDPQEADARSISEGINNGLIKPETWDKCEDPNDHESLEAQSIESIKAVLVSVKPHLIDIFAEKQKEKFLAASLTGLLSSGHYRLKDAAEVIDRAHLYTDAMLKSLEKKEFGQTEQVFDPNC